MDYDIRDEHGYRVLALKGEVDLSCSPEARRLILDSLGDARPTLVDLSGVSYIDSSGIASLVEGFQDARKRRLSFGLVGVSDAALSVLKLARLDRVFSIHDSVLDRVQADG